MNTWKATRIRGTCLILVAALSMAGGTALGASVDVYLRAGVFPKTMPDTNEIIIMWGLALETGPMTTNGSLSVPGPTIVVDEGDDLNIHLYNQLPAASSIMIRGQLAVKTPVWFTDGLGRQRARSFTAETSSGASTIYSWTNLRAGTYLYRSGTHPAVQVQMGLYGALIVNSSSAGQAYADARTAFDTELAPLVYSEIDPALHQAVAADDYGPSKSMTSTVDYNPKYFLINGEPFSTNGVAPIPAGSVGDKVLLRFLNAGLQSHIPLLLGTHMSVVAEDGSVYPFPRVRYALILPAGQTRDAIVTFPSAATYPLYDRMMNLSNGGSGSPGGMLRYLEVAP